MFKRRLLPVLSILVLFHTREVRFNFDGVSGLGKQLRHQHDQVMCFAKVIDKLVL